MKRKCGFILAMLLVISTMLSGCGSKETESESSNKGDKKITIGYYGGTCEAPIFVGYEKGIFADNGLDVELIQVSEDTMKETIGTGKLDCVMLNPGNFKSIEQGLNVKITGGIHTGCIQFVASDESGITKIADLKGKKIGVDCIGGVPMTYMQMELLEVGLDPEKDVEWVTYPSAQLEVALGKGEIDAFGAWDPFPQMAYNNGAGNIFFSTTTDADYSRQFCCYVGLNGNLVSSNKELCKTITKAFDESGAWIEEHPEEAAELIIDKGYVSGDVELNKFLIDQYKWYDAKEDTSEAVKYYFEGMEELNMLDETTDVDKLVDNLVVYLGK